MSKFATQELRKKYAGQTLLKLKKLFPNARMFLNYETPFELLVAVMLSAQCTDKKVNEVTPALFEKYKTVDDYARASIKDLERLVYQTGFYHAKAKHIKEAAKVVRDEFKGQLPRTMKDMLRIPGVGRKTANVVLGNIYGVSEGIAVDTHVRRLSYVLGFSKEKAIPAIERDLMRLFPRKEWFRLTYYLIEYGRLYCPAKKHDHSMCPLGHIDG
ncbi:MAG TPA: endonuclease III [Candidatus Paceibacterota bacterium]|nr:endonuclease III [Candidatus Paceibacterota bacterium]